MNYLKEAESIVKEFEECLDHIEMGTNGIEHMIHRRAVHCAMISIERTITQIENSKDVIDDNSLQSISNIIMDWHKVYAIVETL